eukprot:scaffold67383_cov51-Attheya_sp.AAC.1
METDDSIVIMVNGKSFVLRGGQMCGWLQVWRRYHNHLDEHVGAVCSRMYPRPSIPRLYAGI